MVFPPLDADADPLDARMSPRRKSISNLFPRKGKEKKSAAKHDDDIVKLEKSLFQQGVKLGVIPKQGFATSRTQPVMGSGSGGAPSKEETGQGDLEERLVRD